MMDYVLHVSSFEGLVYGAKHYRGRVQGPSPAPCHGNTTTYHGAKGPLQGKTTCTEGHELPRRVEWDVDAEWTEARYNRWAAKEFDGDSPAGFLDEAELLKAAVRRFRGEIPDAWFLQSGVPGQPGDRLFYGCMADPDAELEQPDRSPLPPWGSILAEIPPADPAERKEAGHDAAV
jgi:hypothetical protein